MNLFRKTAIKYRLWAILALVVVGVGLITIVSLTQIRSQMMDEKEAQARKLVETAHSVLLSFHQQASKGEIDPDSAKKSALESIKALRYDGNNYFWINDMHPRMVMHPIKPKLDSKDLSTFKDPSGHHLFNSMVDIVRKNGEGMVPYLWPKPGSEQPVAKISFVKGFQPWGWIIGSGIYIDDIDQAFRENSATIGAISALILLILVIVMTLIIRSIIQPLKVSTVAMHDIAAGEGDLTRRLPTGGKDEVTELAIAFNEFTGKIQHIIGQVSESARQVVVGVDQLAEASTRNGDNISRQELETQQVATAVTEMAATVSEIARSADSAAQATHEADNETAAGQTVVTETVNSINILAKEVTRVSALINRLDSESESIGSVLDVIRGIAEQTNLLALNAAIEAARAGEQGRGFAVVADEVRTLAARTQESTQEIQQMIEALQTESREAVKAMEKGQSSAQQTVEKATLASDSLNCIVNSVTTISDMNTQIATAAEEQTATAQDIDRSVVQISQLSQQSAQGMTQITQATQDLARVSDSLSNLVSQFKVQ